MQKRWQHYGPVLGAALLAGSLVFGGSPAQAAPPPPPPGPPLEGPLPPSSVLAVDPSTVRPPGPGVTPFAATASCPPARPG